MPMLRKKGIYLVDESGLEHFYDLDSFFEYGPNDFIEWVADFQPIRVGDIVRVTDVGKAYTTYYEWFARNKINIDIAARYAYDYTILPERFEGEDFVVVACGKHENGLEMFAIAQAGKYQDNSVYLFNKEGIKKI